MSSRAATAFRRGSDAGAWEWCGLYKTVTFGISAAYTGIAGALSASAIAFVAPDSFNFFLSIKFLIGLVVGGVGSLAGSVVGGIFYVLVDNSAQALSTFVKNDLGLQFDLSAYTVFGILLIVLMYLMPMGIVGGVYTGRALRGGALAPAGCRQPPAAGEPVGSVLRTYRVTSEE